MVIKSEKDHKMDKIIDVQPTANQQSLILFLPTPKRSITRLRWVKLCFVIFLSCLIRVWPCIRANCLMNRSVPKLHGSLPVAFTRRVHGLHGCLRQHCSITSHNRRWSVAGWLTEPFRQATCRIKGLKRDLLTLPCQFRSCGPRITTYLTSCFRLCGSMFLYVFNVF